MKTTKTIFFPALVNGEEITNELKMFQIFCNKQEDFEGCGFGAGVIAMYREWKKYKEFYMLHNQEEASRNAKLEMEREERAILRKAKREEEKKKREEARQKKIKKAAK